MSRPPDGLAAYRATPEFTAATVPAGLLRDHRTAAGVWGLIEVACGSVALTRAGGGVEEVAPGRPAWVAPGETHSVALSPDAAFRVVFHRQG